MSSAAGRKEIFSGDVSHSHCRCNYFFSRLFMQTALCMSQMQVLLVWVCFGGASKHCLQCWSWNYVVRFQRRTKCIVTIVENHQWCRSAFWSNRNWHISESPSHVTSKFMLLAKSLFLDFDLLNGGVASTFSSSYLEDPLSVHSGFFLWRLKALVPESVTKVRINASCKVRWTHLAFVSTNLELCVSRPKSSEAENRFANVVRLHSDQIQLPKPKTKRKCIFQGLLSAFLASANLQRSLTPSLNRKGSSEML